MRIGVYGNFGLKWCDRADLYLGSRQYVVFFCTRRRLVKYTRLLRPARPGSIQSTKSTGLGRWLVRGLVALSLIILSFFAILVLLTMFPSCGPVSRADAIVVLGGGGEHGRLSQSSARRTDLGISLWDQGVAPVLVTSGAFGPPPVAVTMASRAESRGVPADRIVIEPRSVSTEQNALFVKQLAEQHGWASIILVTDDFHMARAAWMFRDQGFSVQTACSSDSREPLRSRVANRLHEVGGLAYYALTRGWLTDNSESPFASAPSSRT